MLRLVSLDEPKSFVECSRARVHLQHGYGHSLTRLPCLRDDRAHHGSPDFLILKRRCDAQGVDFQLAIDMFDHHKTHVASVLMDDLGGGKVKLFVELSALS